MPASHVETLGEVSRGKNVFLSQYVLAGSVVVLVLVVSVVEPDLVAQPLFYAGFLTVVVLTLVVSLIRWPTSSAVAMAVPLLDIVAIMLMRAENSTLGVTFFLVIPVIWLARDFAKAGALIGPLFSAILLWWSAIADLGGEPLNVSTLPRFIAIPTLLAFAAVSTSASARENRARGKLLNRQSMLLENALERSSKERRLLDELLDAVEFGVMRFDASGRELFVNRRMREWEMDMGGIGTAWRRSRSYCADGVTPLDPKADPLTRAVAGELVEEQILWVGHPGQWRRAFSISSTMLDDDGEPIGSIVIVRDVTAETRAIRERDDFVASASHELRNPLTSVVGFLELVDDAPELRPETRRFLDSARAGSERMLRLVSDLLRESRDRAAPYLLASDDVDLGAVVRGSVDAATPAARSAGVTVEVDVPEALWVRGDAFRLRQVLDNLLSNAVKYNRSGGRVRVTARSDEMFVSVAIADTGRGMTENEMAQIFTRYFRSDAVRSGAVHGVGLGLGIARDIARQSGGDITVSSVPGEGSVFTLRLPRARAGREEER